MAGLSGYQAYLGVARQTAKGSAATVAKFTNAFTGGSAGPERVVERLQETDNNRDPGSAYLQRGGAAGSPELYVRPDSCVPYILGALGNIEAATGAAGAWVHEINSNAGTLPYFSFFKMLGGKVYERYEDCMINSLTIRAEAGQPLTMVVNFMGLSSTITGTEWATTPARDADAPFFFHEATVTLASGVTSNVRSFEMTIENNVSQQQTDSIALYDVVPGRRDLSFSFDMIFDDTAAYNEYRTWMYGSTSGTTQSNSLQTTSLNFTFTKPTGGDVLEIDLPSAAFEEFPVDPDAGGDPVISSIRGAGIRPASGNFVTVTVTNDTANAAGADYGT